MTRTHAATPPRRRLATSPRRAAGARAAARAGPSAVGAPAAAACHARRPQRPCGAAGPAARPRRRWRARSWPRAPAIRAESQSVDGRRPRPPRAAWRGAPACWERRRPAQRPRRGAERSAVRGSTTLQRLENPSRAGRRDGPATARRPPLRRAWPPACHGSVPSARAPRGGARDDVFPALLQRAARFQLFPSRPSDRADAPTALAGGQELDERIVVEVEQLLEVDAAVRVLAERALAVGTLVSHGCCFESSAGPNGA